MHILENAIYNGLLQSVLLESATNVAQRKKRETWFQVTRDIASSMKSQNTFS